ncbi:hypothetical protein ACHAXN_010911 [Cyclotella atomus]
MSASSSNSGASQPLADVLPWGSPLTLTTPVSSQSIAAPSQDFSASGEDAECKSTSRTLLITDSLSTDARFMLHTLALQFLSSKSMLPSDTDGKLDEGSVLWISCGSPPVTDKQIALGLRKAMQHNLGSFGGDGSNVIRSSNLGSVNVVYIPSELAEAALLSEENFSHDSYIKRLYRRVVHWLHTRDLASHDKIDQIVGQHNDGQRANRGPILIILDGVTTLASLFSDSLTQMFVLSVSAALARYTHTPQMNSHSKATITVTNLLAIRCTSPDDGGLYNILDLNEFEDTGRTKGQKLRSEYSRLLRPWLGVGSYGAGSDDQMFHLEEQSHCLSLQTHSIPQLLNKSGWYELADAIVDVSPLESGYARDVLGRLTFTTSWNGKGWWGESQTHTKKGASEENTASQGGHFGSICVNYRCDDSGVRIMRLRSGK